MRAGVFAAVGVGLSAAGHAAVAGDSPSLLGLLIGGAGTLAIARLLTGRERRFGAILGWLLWAQIALHLLFELTGPHGGTSAVGAGEAHHAVAVPSAAPESGAWMLLAHLLAATASAWWLRQGESAVFFTVRLLAALLLDPLRWLLGPLPALPHPAPATAGPAEPDHLAQSPHVRVAAPRGPPRPIRSV